MGGLARHAGNRIPAARPRTSLCADGLARPPTRDRPQPEPRRTRERPHARATTRLRHRWRREERGAPQRDAVVVWWWTATAAPGASATGRRRRSLQGRTCGGPGVAVAGRRRTTVDWQDLCCLRRGKTRRTRAGQAKVFVRAWSMSAIRSSTCSIPTAKRTVDSLICARACSSALKSLAEEQLHRRHQRIRRPKLAVVTNRSSASMNAHVVFSFALRSNVSTPPKSAHLLARQRVPGIVRQARDR